MNSGNMSLVFFTVLFQCAVGMSLFIACYTRRSHTATEHFANVPSIPNKTIQKLWLWVAVLTGTSLVASLFHLSKPWAAPMALRNIGTAWLSAEILFAGLFFALTAFILWRLRSCPLDKVRSMFAATAFVGVVAIITQGLTYAPEAMPAIANGFPLVLFALSAIILGAGIVRMSLKETCTCVCSVYTTSLWIMLALLLVVPCVWVSGSTSMRLTALAWVGAWTFWLGIACLALALFLVRKKRPQGSVVCAALGIFLGRIVFFDCTVHTASLLGLP